MYMLHFSQLHGDFIIINTNTNIQEINTHLSTWHVLQEGISHLSNFPLISLYAWVVILYLLHVGFHIYKHPLLNIKKPTRGSQSLYRTPGHHSYKLN
jgi:hypothetical protein